MSGKARPILNILLCNTFRNQFELDCRSGYHLLNYYYYYFAISLCHDVKQLLYVRTSHLNFLFKKNKFLQIINLYFSVVVCLPSKISPYYSFPFNLNQLITFIFPPEFLLQIFFLEF